MALGYTYQNLIVLVGSKDDTTRTSVTMDAVYDSAISVVIIPTGGMSKLNLSLLYTMASGETSNTIEIRVESSSDGTNFYRIPNDTTSGDTSTLTRREFVYAGVDGVASSLSLPLDIADEFYRFAFKETGSVGTAGTLFVEVMLSGSK